MAEAQRSHSSAVPQRRSLAARKAIADVTKDKQLLDERWNELRTIDLASLNKQLAAAGLPQIEMK
jgi:hypothetical protein